MTIERTIESEAEKDLRKTLTIAGTAVAAILLKDAINDLKLHEYANALFNTIYSTAALLPVYIANLYKPR